MRHIQGAYTTYVNIKRKRAGHLFQGRYKAIMVEADAYTLKLSRSMHLNPAKAGMVAKPEQSQWSSYRSYIGHSTTPAWLKPDFILGSFGRNASDAKNSYRRCVEKLLNGAYESPLIATVASTVLGRSAFVREVTERHLGEKRSERSMQAVKALAPRPAMDAIIMTIKAELGDRAESLSNVSIYGCQQYSGAQRKDIGERFGISDAAVSQASRRLALKAETDQHMQEMLDRVETLLSNVTSRDLTPVIPGP
jgi:putative transposase